MLKSRKKKPFNLLAFNILKITIFFETAKFYRGNVLKIKVKASKLPCR